MKIESSPKSRIYWIIGAIVAIAISIYYGMDMIQLYEAEKLWGYRPLSLLFWAYLGLSFLWAGIRKVSNKHVRNYLHATVAGLLLAISFPPLPFLPLIIPAWMLIISLTHRLSNESKGYQYRIFFHIFILWNIITTYWIANTAFAAGIVAIFTNSLLMAVPLLVFNLLQKNISTMMHFLLFAACWISFEYFHFRWEAHWPWLALGHYFMDQSWLIQWYEWTGILGGSLWILASSWLCWRLFQVKSKNKYLAGLGVLLIVPVFISFYLGQHEIVDSDQTMVAIVQPNYEPHYVKGQIPKSVEVKHFLNLSENIVTDETDYLIFPETSFGINLNKWDQSMAVVQLNSFLDKYPNLTLISGLETNRILEKGDPHDEYTRTYIRGLDTIYWENHNTAVRMASSMEKEIYYKSKLVPGAEFFPFKETLFFLKPLMDKLGGSGSGLRKQKERSALEGVDGHRVAPVICYESVYGEYVNGYFDKGAEWIAVMTNDGWWDNTGGHRQHLGLSVLRAIEQRKWIARAANTGISCFINPQGEIMQPTEYGVDATLTQNIMTNSLRTIYSKSGDVLGRIMLLLLTGAILYATGRKFNS